MFTGNGTYFLGEGLGEQDSLPMVDLFVGDFALSLSFLSREPPRLLLRSLDGDLECELERPRRYRRGLRDFFC